MNTIQDDASDHSLERGFSKKTFDGVEPLETKTYFKDGLNLEGLRPSTTS